MASSSASTESSMESRCWCARGQNGTARARSRRPICSRCPSAAARSGAPLQTRCQSWSPGANSSRVVDAHRHEARRHRRRERHRRGDDDGHVLAAHAGLRRRRPRGPGATRGRERDARGAQPAQAEGSAEQDATVKVGTAAFESVAGYTPGRETQQWLGTAAHYALQRGRGVNYMLASERAPELRRGFGTVYGSLVWATADEGAVPALGLSKQPGEIPLGVHAYALGAHWVYGATLEGCRRIASSLLDGVGAFGRHHRRHPAFGDVDAGPRRRDDYAGVQVGRLAGAASRRRPGPRWRRSGAASRPPAPRARRRRCACRRSSACAPCRPCGPGALAPARSRPPRARPRWR